MTDQQAKGQPTPEGDSSTPAETPKDDSTPNPVTKLDPDVKRHVDKAAGEARKKGEQKGEERGRQAGVSELLQTLGLESSEELQAIVQERRQMQEAQATEAEKMQKALEKTAKERDEQKTELEELYAHIATLTQETALRDAFSTVNIKPERMAAALKLVDMDALDVNDEGDVIGVEDAVKSVKKQLPELFQANNARTIGSSSNPGTDQLSQPGFDKMDDAAFQEMRKRVLFGERIPLK